MNERLKQIRTDAKLTQQEFADRLNVGKFTVAKWESGVRGIHGATVKAVCHEFGVREEWLTEGIEPMYEEHSLQDEIGEFVRTLSDTPPNTFKFQLIRVLSELPEEKWNVLADVAERLYNEMKRNREE